MRQAGTAFVFGPFRLEPDERRLLRDGDPVSITPKAFDLLAFLVAHDDRLLKKVELLEHLWPGVFVEEVNLAQNISAIRRALGGDGRESYIQTVAGAGYRFVAPVRRAAAPPAGHDPAPSATVTARTRLLVLPFRMLKADADLDFLSFSLPDALIAELSALDSVIVRSSLIAARFAGDAPDLQRIAREAQVDLVVSGTLLRAGQELRVSAQLADASVGTVIWSHTAQAPVDDLFQLQDALVERIAASLSQPLSTPERRRFRHDVPATAKAYEYYLRANQAGPASAFSIERAGIARELYLQAISEDPGYAPAWARLARIYRLLGKYTADNAAANLDRADEALQRALALNPDLSIAHNLYAQIDVDRGRVELAMVRLIDRLHHGGPNAELYAGLVQACRFGGLLEASAAAHAHAQRLDPALGTSVMHTYFVMRRYTDVVAVSGEVKGYIYALSLAALGRGDEAVAHIRKLEESGQKVLDLLVSVRALLEGKRSESLEALARSTVTVADPEALHYAARHFAHLDAKDLALSALTRSVAGGYACLGLQTADPWFDSLKGESRFQALADQAREKHQSAAAALRTAGGESLLR